MICLHRNHPRGAFGGPKGVLREGAAIRAQGDVAARCQRSALSDQREHAASHSSKLEGPESAKPRVEARLEQISAGRIALKDAILRSMGHCLSALCPRLVHNLDDRVNRRLRLVLLDTVPALLREQVLAVAG